MKLHVVVAGWLLGPPSGANRRLLRLVAEAAAQLEPGERITVLHGEAFAAPPDARVEWVPCAIPAVPTLARVLGERRLLPEVLARLGATVFDHGFLPLPRSGVPTCLTVHDTRSAEGLTRWPRWLARAVLRRSLRRAAAVIAPSRWTANRLVELAPGIRAPAVVPNGVEVPRRGTARPPLRRPAPNGYLLHVGHLEARKNVGIVVQALAALPPANRPELWLAGRDAGAGSAVAREPFVRWFGAVDDDELPSLYANARAVVVPSRHEGFGLCALEGLAHGRPVLASDAAALPEVLGGHGALLPPGDVAAWTAAIAALGDEDPALGEARRRHARQYSWSAAAASLVEVWRRVHAAHARGVTGPAG